MSEIQKKGRERNIIDKFYTKKSVVKLCIEKIKQVININRKDLIIEPSAGNGSFIEDIKLLSDNFLFYDIEPEEDNIIKQDFLLLDTDNFSNYNNIHIIGNPPFGRQSSTVIKFIRKCEFCNTISFILPKSFKKDSLKNKIPSNFHLMLQCELPYNSFLINEKEYDVPCIFQIWEKKEYDRDKIENIKPIDFIFVKKNDDPDISFRRVGVNAGNICEEIHDKSIQSHYFIKFKKKINSDIFNKLLTIKYETDNTVGPKSISKQELIKKWNDIMINYG